jgi:hypothetical protein
MNAIQSEQKDTIRENARLNNWFKGQYTPPDYSKMTPEEKEEFDRISKENAEKARNRGIFGYEKPKSLIRNYADKTPSIFGKGSAASQQSTLLPSSNNEWKPGYDETMEIYNRAIRGDSRSVRQLSQINPINDPVIAAANKGDINARNRVQGDARKYLKPMFVTNPGYNSQLEMNEKINPENEQYLDDAWKTYISSIRSQKQKMLQDEARLSQERGSTGSLLGRLQQINSMYPK